MNAKAAPRPLGKAARFGSMPSLTRSRAAGEPFIRSAGVRFAVVYATVFGLSAFALAFSLWYATAGLAAATG